MKKDELHLHIQAGIAIWTTELNQKQAVLPDTLRKINPKLKISESSLSKSKTGNDSVSEGKLLQIVKALDYLLESQGFQYNVQKKQYETCEPSGEMPILPIPESLKMPFASIAGVYESYHLSKHGQNILKNIIHIQPDGEVVMYGIDNNVYYGKAYFFQSILLAIQFHQANDYPFYIQIICHIGNYGKLATSQMQHVFGICSSVSIDNEPVAYKRILVKTPNINPTENLASLPESIPLEGESFENLNRRYPNLGGFLKNNPLMISSHKVNDDFV